MAALEVDRGNALPLASIFLLYALTRRRPSNRPSPFPLSLVGSIKALLDSGIIAFLVCSSKTRKRLVFSVDRSFSRLSARGIVVSKELIKQIPYRANTALLLKRQPPSILPFPSLRVSFLSVPSSYMRCIPYILTHAHTRATYMCSCTYIRACMNVTCPVVLYPFPFPAP